VFLRTCSVVIVDGYTEHMQEHTSSTHLNVYSMWTGGHTEP